ncbi:MAG TPA: nuclear transport factor 2 family protein [Acidobacteriaceae bacterium]|nr:nuclear transport factor 2 family protein [Acidobacteriaceae bacterium]
MAGSVPTVALAQQSVQQPPLISEFQKIEDQWSTSLVKQDQFTLETILSPTFVGVSSAGQVMTRNQVVASMFEKEVPQVTMMEQRVVNVRIIEDIAIVDGTYIEETKLNGVKREQRGVFTHIYEHVREVWKCVQSQRTALPIEVQEAKKKKKSEKASSASEPFHIPLFYKGAKSTKQDTGQTGPNQ